MAVLCGEGNAAGDSPVIGHLSRDTAAAPRPSFIIIIIIISASLLQLLTAAGDAVVR